MLENDFFNVKAHHNVISSYIFFFLCQQDSNNTTHDVFEWGISLKISWKLTFGYDFRSANCVPRHQQGGMMGSSICPSPRFPFWMVVGRAPSKRTEKAPFLWKNEKILNHEFRAILPVPNTRMADNFKRMVAPVGYPEVDGSRSLRMVWHPRTSILVERYPATFVLWLLCHSSLATVE